MKTDVIKMRIDSDVKIELEKISELEQRTLAGQIRLALREWLEQKSARPVRVSAAGALRKRPAQQTTAAG